MKYVFLAMRLCNNILITVCCLNYREIIVIANLRIK